MSRLSMMLQAPVTALTISAALVAGATYTLDVPSTIPAAVALVLAAIIVVERFAAGLVAAARYRDLAGLCFVPVHIVRNTAWVAAMIVWSIRTLSGSRRGLLCERKTRACDREKGCRCNE